MTNPTKVVYLSGAIDEAVEYGRPWRRKVSLALKQVGACPYDPAERQKEVCGLSVEALGDLRERNFELFKEKTRLVMIADLDIVGNRSLALVAQVSEHARMGTYAEMGVAVFRQIPLFVILDDPSYRPSGWVVSSAKMLFSDEDQFVSWLLSQHRAGRPYEQILGGSPLGQ
jgi:nucleoside 2-deoxyribosyltransferase